ncbi:MAG: phosphoribosyl-AMP cyclohydrolase [Hyphomicrobiales bacterium]|nr:MAG: phosphoribosyl-AMP cyclohydrolase [Hyphomicrobiales bacterium]
MGEAPLCDETTAVFAPRGERGEIEEGLTLSPKFDQDGLIPAIAADADSGDVLMLAYMNEEALALTIATGEAHYWSRSRSEIWRKGATSGNTQKIVDLRIDCDQDAILMKVTQRGSGASCHLGFKSCFFRAIPTGAAPSADLKLEYREHDKAFDPAEVYGKSTD